MNKEDYVSLEVAKLLREKGFVEYCRMCYYENELYRISCFNDEDMLDGDFHATPTLYEAQKWLRNKKDIHIEVFRARRGWFSSLSHSNSEDYYMEDSIPIGSGFCETYEETLNKGIMEALKLI